MSTKRLVARLDIKSQNVIKGIQMDGLRVVGNPSDLSTTYYEEGIDEILFLDTVASLYGREGIASVIEEVAQNIFVPLTVGGGIRSVEDAHLMLRSGADKVAINSAAVIDPRLLQELSTAYGSQCVVLSVEAKKVGNDWEVFTNNGRDKTDMFVGKWIEGAKRLGVGEVFVTSVDRDGTRRGLDLELMRMVRDTTDLPIIGSGGVGTIDDIIQAFCEVELDAVCIGSALHNRSLNITTIRAQLEGIGVQMRQVV